MSNETKNNFECRHKWIPLLGRNGKKNIPTSLFTCLKCGDLKVGTRTIKISRYRLDMGNKPIRLGTVAGITDDHSVSGATFTLTAGAALTFGQICYMGVDGKMELGDADAASTSTVWAICADATIAENATGNFLLMGFARDDTWNWATLGGTLYLDTATAGGMTQTAPSGTDDVIKICGYAVTADIIYLNPEQTMVIHA